MSREPWEWKLPDLLKLVEEKVEEGQLLEYKSKRDLAYTDGKKKEIGKDISALANAVGGTIIYGIEETKTKPRIPERLDGADPTIFDKEWLEQVISSRIEPRIEGVRINPVKLGDVNRSIAFVVSVPEGKTAYQASDGRYYRRYNSQVLCMKHHEILLLLNKFVAPDVETSLTARSRSPETGFQQGHAKIGLSLLVKNVGHIIADKVYLECLFPSRYVSSVHRFGNSGHGSIVEINSTKYHRFGYYHREPDGLLPLFPSTEYEVFDGNLNFCNLELIETDITVSHSKLISVTVYADNAPPKTVNISIADLFFAN